MFLRHPDFRRKLFGDRGSPSRKKQGRYNKFHYCTNNKYFRLSYLRKMYNLLPSSDGVRRKLAFDLLSLENKILPIRYLGYRNLGKLSVEEESDKLGQCNKSDPNKGNPHMLPRQDSNIVPDGTPEYRCMYTSISSNRIALDYIRSSYLGRDRSNKPIVRKHRSMYWSSIPCSNSSR